MDRSQVCGKVVTGTYSVLPMYMNERDEIIGIDDSHGSVNKLERSFVE